MLNKKKHNKIGIIGLGYVGLPLALKFSEKHQVVGLDLSKNRIIELKKGIDVNKEIQRDQILKRKILFSNNPKSLKDCNIFVITVPTPINNQNKPDLRLLRLACLIVGRFLKKNSMVIIESTVYPGCTEEFCVPILEKKSKLLFNKDFFCGYSPERINPGDKKHTIDKITKIVSASNKISEVRVKQLYKSVTKKVFLTKSIKIAESAKVIENIQRDLNIAFINEVNLILKKLKIDTKQVLKAASTKWNFLNFNPGLVGGHCIGVDPYYLTHRARKSNYNPKVILAGRVLNNYVSDFVLSEIKKLSFKFFGKKKVKLLILGITFKEDIADTRNSQILKIIKKLGNRSFDIYVYDPNAGNNFKFKNKRIKRIKKLKYKNFFDGVFIGVPHKKIIKMGGKKIKSFCKKHSFIYDLKSSISPKYIDASLY